MPEGSAHLDLPQRSLPRAGLIREAASGYVEKGFLCSTESDTVEYCLEGRPTWSYRFQFLRNSVKCCFGGSNVIFALLF